jgi:hypothetical protein
MFFSNSPRKSVHDFSESTAKMAARGKTTPKIRRVAPSHCLYIHIRTVSGSTVTHFFRGGVPFGMATTICVETMGLFALFSLAVPSLATTLAPQISSPAAPIRAVGVSVPAALAYFEYVFAPPACD